MHYIVSYSGGASSWAAARLTKDRLMVDGDRMTLLFADTLIEDKDTYAFLAAGAANLGLPVTRIADGRTPLEVFGDVKWIGNSRIDPCSKILKRSLLHKWYDDQDEPKASVLGLDWMEVNRFERYAARADGLCLAPLIDAGVDKRNIMRMVEEAGLPKQRLYSLGFPHANCGGACVKAGQTQWSLLLRTMPDRYAMWEAGENKLRAELGDHSILTETKDGVTKPLPLSELRARVERQPSLMPAYDWGGCGCAVEGDDDETEE